MTNIAESGGPSIFWEQYATTKSDELAALAQQLLALPANTLSLNRVFVNAGDLTRRLENAWREIHFRRAETEDEAAVCMYEFDQYLEWIERNATLRLNRHFMPKLC